MVEFIFFLVLIVVLAGAVFSYPFHGKAEVIKFDFLQFVYVFVITPIVFVFLKSFLRQMLVTDLHQLIGERGAFMLDTLFSVYFMFLFAFIVIHGLTKSAHLKKMQDPKADLYLYIEYFHLWLSHLVGYVMGMTTVFLFGVLNLLFPLEIDLPRQVMFFVPGTGLVGGIAFYVSLLFADPRQVEVNFFRQMKIIGGVFFLVMVSLYAVAVPRFSGEYLLFWWSLFAFIGLVITSGFVYKSRRVNTWFGSLLRKVSGPRQKKNIQLFAEKR